MKLQRATLGTRYAKVALYGKGKTGKTTTGALLSLALTSLPGTPKSVAMYDTEGGSDFVIKHFDAVEVPLYVTKARSFQTLKEFIDAAEREKVGVLLVDSLTHVYKDLVEAHVRAQSEKVQRACQKSIPMWLWGRIKKEWATFVDWMLNAQLHVVTNGRAGDTYKEAPNGEFVVVGEHMSAEKNFEFEPHLVCSFRRVEDPDGGPDLREVTVEGDRADAIDGHRWTWSRNPNLDEVRQRFQGHLDWLAAAEHSTTVDMTTSVAEGLPDDEGPSFNQADRAECEICLEEIKGAFVSAGYNMRTDIGKRLFTQVLQRVFGTISWKQVQGMPLDDLQAGRARIFRWLSQDPSGIHEGKVVHSAHAGELDVPGASPWRIVRLGKFEEFAPKVVKGRVVLDELRVGGRLVSSPVPGDASGRFDLCGEDDDIEAVAENGEPVFEHWAHFNSDLNIQPASESAAGTEHPDPTLKGDLEEMEIDGANPTPDEEPTT